MRTLVWCAAMTFVWLGTMAYLALDEPGHVDQRSLIGSAVGWVIATALSWLVLRRAVPPRPRLWEIVVVTAPASLVTLVFVSVGAAFVAPPPIA
ncbi:hypothetical protein [Lentzea sp. CA-135723]|uniref:hypothetical protein n=1 Tax=Lentzea sp. CA-135723 TaxID=3239950 RepID=UPI003D92080C